MTSCRPFRRASFPSLGDTTQALVFRPPCDRALPRAGLLELVTRYLQPGTRSVETTGSPTFLGNPNCALALLSDPGRTNASGHINASARPPICPPRRLPHSYFRGSITRLRHWLSTLRRPGRPDTTQDSLPAVGQTLPDGLGYPQGSIERFHDVSYIDPPFPSSLVAQTGWPRAVSRPGLPQTRTCAINAFGSSSYPFATPRHTEWIARR
jgi:hypothetical protein